MAKALKTAAIVVGVAALAVVTGGAAAGLGLSLATTFVVGGAYVSAGALALGAAALSVGSALLTKKPSVTAAQTDRLFANISPRAYRKTPLGSTALPVDVRYEEWSGKDQEYCDWIVEHASCAIEAVQEIWFDTELAWSATTGTVGKYAGYFSVPNLILEGTPQNAFTFASGKWNAATARLVGCAYTRWRFKVTGNSKKAESPFASGLPSRITVIGRGAKLYDPRRDSTVPGGSGPMRADDQSTWRFTADDGVVIGDNLPLQILRVVLGWRIRNPVTGVMLLATGSGVPQRRLRLQSWITSANLADELVNRSAGGQEPRYHGAAVVSEGDDTKQTLDMLCAGCCGRFRDTQGKLALDIAHNDLAAIATDDGLLDDDVIGGFTWDPDPGFDGIPNVIRGQYVDATTGSLYQLLDYPEVRIASPDGVDRVRPVDLGAVESPSQAQRIVKQILQRALFNRKFTAPFDIRAWKYPVGSVLPFTFAPLGFVRVPFRVEAQELGQDGVCNMTLSFEHPAIYAWDKDDAAPVIAADPIVYDASKNPLILAIADAGETAEWELIADRGGKKPDDNADVTGDNTSKDTLAVGGRPVLAVLDAIDKIEPIAATYPDLTAKVDGIAATYPAIVETVGAIEQAQVGTDAALGALDRVAADHAAALAQAERDAGRIGDTLLRLLAESDRTRAILRDAGVVVDPATGIVRIYAVEQLAERTARAEIVLDAANAAITQKASVEYVQQQIALAVLDPVQAAQLEPIIARLTSAEQTISGLGASVSTKAEAMELTRVSGRVTTVQSDLDALAGTVSQKAARSDVDAQGVRIGLVEQTLSTLEGVSSFGVTVRQARAVADDAAEAGLRALLAGDDANRRQIVQQAEVRSELIAKLIDQSGVEAAARQLLAVQIGAVDARGVQESVARIAEGKALSQRIDAQSVTNGEQAAAIASLSEASIAAGTGLAGITTTIRQQAANDDTTAEGLLRALIAGDETGRARATQLAQVQSELSTTLIANEQSSAVARQALTVRMAAAEAAIVTTSRALADLTQSLVERITAAEAIIRDPATGLAATRAQLSEVDRLRADGDAANAQSTATLSAQVNDPATGLPATRGEIIRVAQASADRDTAIAGTVDALSAQVNDPATGLPATRAEQVVERQARADGDSANAEAIGTLSAQVNDPATGLPATRGEIVRVAQASADRDTVIAGTVDALSAQVNDAATGLPATRAQQVVDRQTRAEGDAANARSIDALSVQVNDPATGLPATRVQIGTERDASVERDNALGRRVDTVSASIGDTNAAVAVLGEAMVDGDEANARLIQQVTAKLGDLGEATVQDLIEAVVSETGKILARKVVTVDVNNNLAGWSLIGSEDGPGSFNLINTDLKMGTGRVWFDTGAVMWAMGLGFGKNRDLISWFGPSMPIDQCTRANALEWKGTDLKQYFGGALSAGVIRNAVQTTLTTPGASVSTGPVSSNGRKRTVIVSYSYTYDGEQDGAQAASSGGSSAQMKLYRNGVEIATLNAGGGWQRTAKTNQGPATYSEAIDGSLTIDDNSGGTSPEYRATLIVRSLGPGLSGTPTQDAIAQSISIIQTEELS